MTGRCDTCPGGPACACDGLCTARIGIFTSLSPSDQQLLVKKAGHKKVPAGTLLFSQQDTAAEILIIHEGRVKLNRYSPEGKETVVDIIGPGAIYGEQWLFSGKKHETNAITLDTCNYCEIRRADIEDLIRQHPEVGISMLGELGGKYSKASRMQEILTINDARGRIAGFLLQQHHEEKHVELNIPRDVLAASINLRNETISRRLNEMAQEGILSLRGHRVIILNDLKALQDIFDTAE